MASVEGRERERERYNRAAYSERGEGLGREAFFGNRVYCYQWRAERVRCYRAVYSERRG